MHAQFSINTISPAQKKILFVAGTAMLILCVVWLLIFVPVKIKHKKLAGQLKDLKSQISQIESFISPDGNFDEAMKDIGNRFLVLEEKFPEKEDEGLKMLSESAKEFKVTPFTILSKQKTALTDAEQKNIEIDGKTGQKIQVSFEMKTSYQNLVNYLEKLKTTLPSQMTVDRLNITKDSEVKLLNISMDLNLYILTSSK